MTSTSQQQVGWHWWIFKEHMFNAYPNGFTTEQLRAEWKDFQAFLKANKPKSRLATVREGWRELRLVGKCS